MVGFGVGRQSKKSTLQTISPQVRSIASKLELRWPNNEKKFELQWLQDNYNFLYEFELKLLNAYHEAKSDVKGKPILNTTTTRPYRLLWSVWSQWPGAIETTRQWAVHVNAIAWEWNRWRSNLRKYTLSQKNDKWLMMRCSAYVTSYSLNGEDFYKIVLPMIKKAPVKETRYEFHDRSKSNARNKNDSPKTKTVGDRR